MITIIWYRPNGETNDFTKLPAADPGPLTTSRTVKEAMLFDSCTWDDDYNLGVVQTIRQQLVQLATPADGYTAVLLQGSGSYAVEAVLGSVIGEQGKVLIVSNGAYGARMIEMAQLMGIACHPYDCGEVSRPDAAAIEQILQNDPAITHIAMVHSETTTGMLNPIEEVAELAKRYDKRYIVDAMSSFGGIPLDIAALNIDYLISSANKCIQGVPGFAFVIAVKRSWPPAKAVRARCRWICTPSGAAWRTTTASGASPRRRIPCWPSPRR
ncbi:2-aminoethylphosphonate--pyruvate transaminase [Klebsiella pneumoniae]|uniref:2-aminoethylphosphonate--pyruvate transaminase n=1 Tax=Klebsiella pneumoniae TaxID=573 RepID=A0A377TI22_KLEPN|nr:2-aminoethylphosphonate--pyruvate transaminase [Klebsiella pneumoniae]